MSEIILSPKFKAFLKNKEYVFEFLESCTHTGKTTVGVIKFLFSVAESSKKFHALCGLDLGVIERNIINKDCGLLEVFGALTHYYSNGHGDITLPHIVYNTPTGQKIIYCIGYADRSKWKKVLGTQFGVIFIDEANQADLAFIQEITMRCDTGFFTQNPDNPGLPWYEQYVNKSRPLPGYEKDYPQELLAMLDREARPSWVHWFFNFGDNAALTSDKRDKIIAAVPKGTKQYFTKILGLRRKATGVVFVNFDRPRHVISRQQAKALIRNKNNCGQSEWFISFSAGLDTSYSQNSPDTVYMAFVGITNKRRVVVLDERTYNNRDLGTPIAPSDTVLNMLDFLERNRQDWGLARDVFIDSADQATITEFNKYKRLHGSIYNFVGAWKKTTIIDRINLQLGWFAHDEFLVVETCVVYISELEVYSWKENKDNEPEDGNDHGINAVQYAWLPHKTKIGGVNDGKKLVQDHG